GEFDGYSLLKLLVDEVVFYSSIFIGLTHQGEPVGKIPGNGKLVFRQRLRQLTLPHGTVAEQAGIEVLYQCDVGLCIHTDVTILVTWVKAWEFDKITVIRQR